jgi:hypothetical protein
MPSRVGGPGPLSNSDDHHPALGPLVLLVVALTLGRTRTLVGLRYGQLELGSLVASTFLLLAASDLFDDPGLEHRKALHILLAI